VLVAILGACILQESSRSGEKTPNDKVIAGFRLRDYRGAWHSLGDFAKDKLVVVAFLGAECPLSARYAPRLAALAKEFGSKGVGFLAVDSNRQDSITQIGRLAKEHGIAFPVVKDVSNKIADLFTAERTPQVFVLDKRRAIRYRGRIDDQFGIGYSRPKPARSDLAEALVELLAGRPVSQPVTKAAGCLIGRVPKRTATGEVTYAKQISRILRERCATCHQAGAIAPFALTSYGDAAGWAETIREVIEEERMPPWHANPKHGTFANDPRMPDKEKKLVYQWVENGAPEGDPKDGPSPVPLADGWRIAKPDLIVAMPKPFKVLAEGTIPYQFFVVDPGLKEDKWVRASEARPGNRSVVHHLVVFALPPGHRGPVGARDLGTNFVAGGGPGTPPMVFGDGQAKLLPAGSKLVFEIHYTPNGLAQTDMSRVGFVFADPKTIRKEVKSEAVLNMRFRIPAGAANYRVEASHKFRQDTVLYSLMPHMHLRGKSFRFEAIYPNQRSEILLDVPRYSFEWQNFYVLSKPKLLPEGTVLRCVGHFDNSDGNLSNPDPKAAVTFGLQTWDEMMVGYFDMALAEQDLRHGPPKAKALGDGRYEVVFTYTPTARTKAVYLAGSFNDWKPKAHLMAGPDAKGAFTTKLVLKNGAYEYKYVLDGTTWKADPANRRQAGIYNNSVLVVGEAKPKPLNAYKQR
jgi:thiol-disulfide isomerase/thioredoxin